MLAFDVPQVLRKTRDTVSTEARRPDLAGLERPELEAALEARGHARFRARQIFRWIHRRGVTRRRGDDRPAARLRATLADAFSLTTPAIVAREQSTDGTEKFLLRLDDGRQIESVFIPDTPAMTFCLSTQVGCAMACAFCLTGRMGLVRNLTAGEIVGQVRVLAGALDMRGATFNIVLMGMGEPLHNYDETMKALRILADEHGFALPPRRVTLSTVGLLPALERLAKEPIMPNLAISLHAPTDAQRGALVPINQKYGVAEIIEACRRFPLKKRSRITFEYVLLAGVNDSPEDARQLATLLAGVKAKVNLIPLNAAAGIPFERPSDQAIDRFAKILADRGILTVSVRKSRGPRHPRRVRSADRGRTKAVARPEPRGRDDERLEARGWGNDDPLNRVAGTRDFDVHPLVPPSSRRDSHLQIVPGHGQRAVLERQGAVRRADLRRAEARREPRGDLADPARPLPDDQAVGPMSHPRRRRARPIGVGKDVHVRERRRFEIRGQPLDVLVGLARESDDDVRADGGVRHPRADAVHEGGVLRDRVRPAHRRQQAIARVLQRQMEMARKAVARRDEIDDVGRAVHRLERADAEERLRPARRQRVFFHPARRGPTPGSLPDLALERRLSRSDGRVERAEQVEQRGSRRQVAAVRAEVHSGQRDLPVTRRDDALDLATDLVRRHAARRPARRRDDAVRSTARRSRSAPAA